MNFSPSVAMKSVLRFVTGTVSKTVSSYIPIALCLCGGLAFKVATDLEGPLSFLLFLVASFLFCGALDLEAERAKRQAKGEAACDMIRLLQASDGVEITITDVTHDQAFTAPERTSNDHET